MDADKEPDWEALWDWIKQDAGLTWNNWEKWQAQFFEGDYSEACFVTGRASGRAQARLWFQQFALADAINRGDIAGYIKSWHPQPAPSIEATWRIIESECDINFGVIIDQVDIPEGVGKARSGHTIAINHAADPFDGNLIAWASGPASDSPALGGEDRRMGKPHQTRKAFAVTVLDGAFCYCLVALGRLIGLFHKARRHR